MIPILVTTFVVSKLGLSRGDDKTGAPVVISDLSDSHHLTYYVVSHQERGETVTTFLISLDELERVKRVNRLETAVDLAAFTKVSRNTWNKALKTRKPTPQILDALAFMGARPDRVLIALSDEDLRAA